MSVGKQEKNRVAKKKQSSKAKNDSAGQPDSIDSLANDQLDRAARELESPHKPWTSPFSTLGIGLMWAMLMWCSFPPLGFWPIGWIATAPLLWLIQVKQLPSKKPYRQLLLVGFVYWLATLYFIPIPHWALWFGWLTVSIYLAVYTPLFIFGARAMVHRMNVPLVIAAPVAWVATEWIRCVAFTGQGMVCLSHTQYTQPILIQTADLFGAYTVSFCLVAFAACYVRFFLYRSGGDTRPQWKFAIGGLVVAGLVTGYGAWQLNQPLGSTDDESKLNVAIIQGSVDTDLSRMAEVMKEKEKEATLLTWKAREQWADLDLIVWPEGHLPANDWLPETDYSKLTGKLEGLTDREIREGQRDMWRALTGSQYKFRDSVPLIAGTGCVNPTERVIYNGAVLFDENGSIQKRYFKNHLVMFGEYTPLSNWLTFLKWLPIADTAAGDSPEVFEVKGIKLAPNICFESTVPHLIRRQMNELERVGNEPDVMLNLTNDGWFYGTSCLDFHLACNVFRAVEMRKPHLVCANTGLSAEIDSRGQLLRVGPRRDTQILQCHVIRNRTPKGLYRWTGDGAAILLTVIFLFACIANWKHNLISRAQTRDVDGQESIGNRITIPS